MNPAKTLVSGCLLPPILISIIGPGSRLLDQGILYGFSRDSIHLLEFADSGEFMSTTTSLCDNA